MGSELGRARAREERIAVVETGGLKERDWRRRPCARHSNRRTIAVTALSTASIWRQGSLLRRRGGFLH